MKKALSVILLASMLASLSCGSAGTASTDTTVGAEETTAAVETTTTVYDLLPEKDYEGRAYNILCSSTWSADMLNQMWVESETGDVVLDSVYQRNRAVEEAFNVKITARAIDYNEIANTIQREVLAGDQTTDLVTHSPVKLAPLASEKIFYDINELPYADKAQPWYVQSVNEEIEFAGKQYMFLTDMGFVFVSAANVMLYNRDMAQELKLPNIQQLVLDGKWTLDELEKSMVNVYSDVNGNTESDNGDRFAISHIWNEMSATLPYSLGQKITEKDASGKPVLVLGSERMANIVERCNEIFNQNESVYHVNTSAGEGFKTTQEMFRDGKALYCILNVSSITKDRIRDSVYDYVPIPMPKYDENQDKYYTGISLGSSTIHAIPATTPDPEFTSIITEALSYEGSQRVLPAFVETAVKVKYANDEESKQVYDLIFDGLIIDFAALYDSTGVFNLFQNLMKAKSAGFMSEFDAIADLTAAKFDEIYEQFK